MEEDKEGYIYPYSWQGIYEPADEWLITCAITPFVLSSHNFALGHTIELYMKAAYVKLYNITHLKDDPNNLLHTHYIRKLLKKCKEKDNSFLPNYELRDNLFNKPYFGSYNEYKHLVNLGKIPKLSDEEHMHFLMNQEFYFIDGFITNLKYGDMPIGKFPSGYAESWGFPSTYWIAFFKEIRGYFSKDLKDSHYEDLVAVYLRDLLGKRNENDSEMIELKRDRPASLYFLQSLYS